MTSNGESKSMRNYQKSENNNENISDSSSHLPEWKKQLTLLHQRTPVKTLADYPLSTGKDNKLSRRDDYFRDLKENHLAFVDPALSIFDMSTPKYKMTPIEDHTSSSFWENSFIKATPETKIIDYMSNINARDNHRADVNMETPTRPIPTRLDMDTPDSHSKSQSQSQVNNSFLNKNVRKALNFGSSIDGDMSVIMKDTDASIIDLSDTEETPRENLLQQDDNLKTPILYDAKTTTTTTLAPPTQDTSPDSAVLKESELKTELLTKFSRNALNSPGFPHEINSKQHNVVSPVKDKEECEFTKHLTANIAYNDNDNDNENDISFVDALNTKPIKKGNEITTIVAAPSPASAASPAAPVGSVGGSGGGGSATAGRVTHIVNKPNEKNERKVSPARSVKKPQVNEAEQKDDLVDEWKETKTPQGKSYFYNRRTRQSAWKLPDDAVHIPTGTGGYRIFTSRKEVDPHETSISLLTQAPPNQILTPVSTRKPTSETHEGKPAVVLTNQHQPLQTPPRSRTHSTSVFTNPTPSPGVAFIKKTAEKDEKLSLLHCPLCGKFCETGNPLQDHLAQCVMDRQQPDETKIELLVSLESSLSRFLSSLKRATGEEKHQRPRDQGFKSPPPLSQTSRHERNVSPMSEKRSQSHPPATASANATATAPSAVSAIPPPVNSDLTSYYTTHHHHHHQPNQPTQQRRDRSPGVDNYTNDLHTPIVEGTHSTTSSNSSNLTGQKRASSNGSATTAVLSETLPLSIPSSRDSPHDEVKTKSRIPTSSLFACPCCKISLKTRDDLVMHLRTCSRITEDITSTRSDSYLMRSASPNKKPVRLYHKDDGSLSKVDQKLNPSGCPFCGKGPLPNNILSSHLLSCQKKKESKDRREAHANTQHPPSTAEQSRRSSSSRSTAMQRTPSPSSSTVATPASHNKIYRGFDKSTPRSGSSVPHVSR